MSTRARGPANSITALLFLAAAAPGRASDAVEGTLSAADGLALRYRVVGFEGPAVVVPLAAHLARELSPLANGRRLVFYDPAGRGASERLADPASAGLARDLADLESVRRGLGLETFSLVGWSYYGAVVARYAIEHPERVERMALLSPLPPRADPYLAETFEEFAAGLPEDFAAQVEALRRAGLEKRDPVAFAREAARLASPASFADPAAFDRIESEPWRHGNEWRERLDPLISAQLASLGAYDWRKALHDLKTPTLVVRGQRDIVPAAAAREWVEGRDARLLHVLGAAHHPAVEQKDAVLAGLDRFLSGGWPDGSEIVGDEREDHDH